jgi:hypothetical protein
MESNALPMTAFLRGLVRLLTVLQMSELAFRDFPSRGAMIADLMAAAHLALAVEHQARIIVPPQGGEAVRDRVVEIAATQYELLCALLAGDLDGAETAAATQHETALLIRLDIERLWAVITIS